MDSLGSSTIHEAYDIPCLPASPGPFLFPPTTISLAHRNNNNINNNNNTTTNTAPTVTAPGARRLHREIRTVYMARR